MVKTKKRGGRYCAVAGCKNALEHRDNLIVLPHVQDLRFHQPSRLKEHDDIGTWSKALLKEQENLPQKSLNICSNHFRYGEVRYSDRTPSFYLRGYPEWALTVQQLGIALKELDDSLVATVLTHLLQYVNVPVKHIDAQLLTTSEARTELVSILHIVPVGKQQEAIAMYVKGVEFDGVKPVRISMQISTAIPRQDIPIQQVKPITTDLIPTYTEEEKTGHSSLQTNTDQDAEMESQGQSSQGTTASQEMDFLPEGIGACSQDHTYSSYSNLTVKKCKKIKGCMKRKCRVNNSLLVKYKKKVMFGNKKIENLQYNNSVLKHKLQSMEKKNQLLHDELSIVKHDSKLINQIKKSDEVTKLHTGLPSYAIFDWVYSEIKDSALTLQYWSNKENQGSNEGPSKGSKRGPKRSLSCEEELLITLMKLKLNCLEEHLAFLFGVSGSLISQIISTWIPFLALELEALIYWPSSEEILNHYPLCFQKWEGVKAILDCFEIPCEKPSHIEANSQIFSSYKNRPTVKFLLACTPGGSVSFISESAGGLMSDKKLVLESGILEKFTVGDACMCDKGFRIEGELLERGVRLLIPPFVQKGNPFSEKENKKNKDITHARIHVERCIGRVRDYLYLNQVVPITQLDIISPAVKVCCILTNLKGILVKR